MNVCFKDAPSLGNFKKNESNYNQVKPSVMCQNAIETFKKFSPNSKVLDYAEDDCKITERDSSMWACMLAFAEDGDSLNYAFGQCFPRD